MARESKKVVGKYNLGIVFYNDGGVEVKVTGGTNDMRVISVLEIEKIRFINTMMSQAKKSTQGIPGPTAGKPPEA